MHGDLPDIVEYIGRDTELKHAGHHELCGPCPLCHAGKDRFHVWTDNQRWACLGPEAGRAGCGIGGDLIEYVKRRDGVNYYTACETLRIEPKNGARKHVSTSGNITYEVAVEPCPQWRQMAFDRAVEWKENLWGNVGTKAREWLHGRGLLDGTIEVSNLGYNPCDTSSPWAMWGLDDRGEALYVPRGIVIPWTNLGEMWRVNVRRPVSKAQVAGGISKYLMVAGSGNGLYGIDNATQGRIIVLVEGEFDAIALDQEAGHLVAAVATGSAGGSRRRQWIDLLKSSPLVLIAYDTDKAGQESSTWWLKTLVNSVRLEPTCHDVNDMLTSKADIAGWVEKGIEEGRKALSKRYIYTAESVPAMLKALKDKKGIK